MIFKDLPKVELHQHLDCSLSYDVVKKINPQISLDNYKENFIAPAKCTDLADFLKRAPQGFKLMQNEKNLRLVVDDLFQQLAYDSVIYAELRFAPLQHTENGLKPDEVVAIVDEQFSKAIADTGIEARIILCTLRHYSETQSMETVKLVEKFLGTNVVGFDIAADEAGFPITEHVSAFQYAYKNRIHCTAHAGEAKGAESVWETLHNFYPSRIGHGVRSIEDPDLIKHLKENNIHLEVCPTCNVQIDVFAEYKDHPINKLYELGVSVGVNTDTRTITNVTLTDEYRKLNEIFGWNKYHFLTCNLNAVKSSFIPEKLKKELSSRLVNEYQKT